MDNSSLEISEQYRHAVQNVIRRNQWQLWTEEEFVTYVAAQLSQQRLQEQPEVEKQIGRQAIHLYCAEALYPACLGREGTERQNRGFLELANYLKRIAYNRWPEFADEGTQLALVRIYEQMEACRIPGAFLAFAIQKLRDVIRTLMQQNQRYMTFAEMTETGLHRQIESTLRLGFWSSSNQTGNPVDSAVSHDIANRFETIWQGETKARRQLSAVWLRYGEEMSNDEIASILETTSQNVSVLLTRGLAKLRTDQVLCKLAGEILNQLDTSA